MAKIKIIPQICTNCNKEQKMVSQDDTLGELIKIKYKCSCGCSTLALFERNTGCTNKYFFDKEGKQEGYIYQ